MVDHTNVYHLRPPQPAEATTGLKEPIFQLNTKTRAPLHYFELRFETERSNTFTTS
jgi:hypothetical protein